jgi:plasmid stabilization system protein ParE
MILVLARSDDFWADLQRQVDWYRDQAGPEVATGYVDAVEATLHQLAKAPGDWPTSVLGLAGACGDSFLARPQALSPAPDFLPVRRPDAFRRARHSWCPRFAPTAA